MIRAVLALFVFAAPAAADTLVAAHTIRAQTVLTYADLAIVPGKVPGGLTDHSHAIGQEALVTLYAGRPIRLGDLGPPAMVERNQIVRLTYTVGGVTIGADARALDRAGAGDRLRVMNLSSRSIVTATVLPDGRLIVNGPTQ